MQNHLRVCNAAVLEWWCTVCYYDSVSEWVKKTKLFTFDGVSLKTHENVAPWFVTPFDKHSVGRLSLEIKLLKKIRTRKDSLTLSAASFLMTRRNSFNLFAKENATWKTGIRMCVNPGREHLYPLVSATLNFSHLFSFFQTSGRWDIPQQRLWNTTDCSKSGVFRC